MALISNQYSSDGNHANENEDERTKLVIRNLSSSSKESDSAATASSKMPLIQILNASDDWEKSDDGQSDLPPLLLHQPSITDKGGMRERDISGGMTTSSAGHCSLMDQMIKDAHEAQQEKALRRESEERKVTKKFGTGLKKGFLKACNSTRSTTKNSDGKLHREKENNASQKKVRSSSQTVTVVSNLSYNTLAVIALFDQRH